MLNTNDILETIRMIHTDHLDIRTITMGISLLDCAADDADVFASRIYDKITKSAERLVPVGEEIEKELGIPIVNKRISVTPIAVAGGALRGDGMLKAARALDRAADATGVNFIGGFSALVQKGATPAVRSSPPSRRRSPRPNGSARRSTSPPPRRASIWTPSAQWVGL